MPEIWASCLWERSESHTTPQTSFIHAALTPTTFLAMSARTMHVELVVRSTVLHPSMLDASEGCTVKDGMVQRVRP